MAGFGLGPYGNGPYGIGDTGTGQSIQPPGWESSQFGSPQAIGGSFPQTLNVSGWTSTELGSYLVAFRIRVVLFSGWESSQFGNMQILGGYPATLFPAGWASSTFGSARVDPLTVFPVGWESTEFGGDTFIDFRVRTRFPQGWDSAEVAQPDPTLSPRTYMRVYNVNPPPNNYQPTTLNLTGWDSLSVPVVNVYNQASYVLPAHTCPPGMGIPSVANV